VWLAVAAWAAATGQAEAVLVEVVGNGRATGGLVLVAGDLETPAVAALDADLTSLVLTVGFLGGKDPTQPSGPLFADVTMWQQSAGLINAASVVTGDGTLSGTGDASASEPRVGSGSALDPASVAGMLGTIEGVIGTSATGTIDGTVGSTGSGSLEGTIGPTATVTLQGTVTDPSSVPIPPSAGLFAAGAAAWAGWRRWMRRAGRG
jgi:hypothetical protein